MMNVSDLIKPIYDKKKFKELKSKIEKLINDIQKDSKNLNIEQLEKLIRQWETFDKTFNITKQRISEIEEIGHKILLMIDDKLKIVDDIGALNKELVDIIRKKLLFIKKTIETHLIIQKKRYTDELMRKSR
jgi:division protein CdvB (Snf7/Vps24/ESCRT-III family)